MARTSNAVYLTGAATILGFSALLLGIECSPPACRGTEGDGLAPCDEEHMRVCQARFCARIETEEGAPCTIDPCSDDGVICGNGMGCREIDIFGASGSVCVRDLRLGGPCDPEADAVSGCPFITTCVAVGPEYPGCPPRPGSFSEDEHGACYFGRPAGATCDASWAEDVVSCQRCEAGLVCEDGTCKQPCENADDCECGTNCVEGYCPVPGPCTPGEVCALPLNACGLCIDTTGGPFCVPVGVDAEEGECLADPSPAACEPASCDEDQQSICQARRCALVVGYMESCTPDPCNAEDPVICRYPLACRENATEDHRCIMESSGDPYLVAGCSARSPRSAWGNACPYPFVCNGFDGEVSGEPGGCEPRGDLIGYHSFCVLGQTRGQACDSDFMERVSSCARCEPGLECVDSRCQMPCSTSADCPCEEVCNGGLCGPSCGPTGTPCQVAPGSCGTCTSAGTCAPTGTNEGCGGSPEVDDDCDGLVDEATRDDKCDGVDDGCDGSIDEDWTDTREYIPTCQSDLCPGFSLDLPGHYECSGGELECKVDPGRDICTEPGAFPGWRGGWIFCGRGDGEPCTDAPCALGGDCVAGVCVGQPSSSCWYPCDPAEVTSCVPCEPHRSNECEWPFEP